MDVCLAIKGKKFAIEWYFDGRGYSQAYEYFKLSSQAQQDRVLALFRLMAEQGKIWDETKFRNEDDGIYAFKLNQDRYLSFFFKGGKIIVASAFTKKTAKMPAREKKKALTAYENYIERVEEGTYYEKKR